MSWAEARTLADMGQCVALWLEQKLPHMPTSIHCDVVSTETLRLVPVLARLNRSGRFITDCSQPACSPTDQSYGGFRPWQRAAVMGYVPAGAIHQIRQLLGSTPGLDLKISLPGAPHSESTQVSCLTTSGAEVRLFGGVLSRREIALHYGPIPGWNDHPGLDPAVIGALQAAYQVSVVDQRWGRNSTLWPTLDQLA